MLEKHNCWRLSKVQIQQWQWPPTNDFLRQSDILPILTQTLFWLISCLVGRWISRQVFEGLWTLWARTPAEQLHKGNGSYRSTNWSAGPWDICSEVENWLYDYEQACSFENVQIYRDVCNGRYMANLYVTVCFSSYRSSWIWLNICQCDDTKHHESEWMSVSVMLEVVNNLTKCLSVWCYRSSSIWLNVCQCDGTKHHESDWMSVSVMSQLIIDLTECLSVWCYSSSSIWLNVCQCGVTAHHRSDWMSVWCYSSSSIWLNVCQCDVTDHLCQCDGSD